jgi:Beta-galactosidase
MRIPIAVQVKSYDIENAQPQIDEVRDAFGRYLAGYYAKAATKHGLMGPVGKILREVKSGRRDPSSLKGYALRVHEASNARLSRDSMSALEDGIDRLVDLLSETPVTVHERILDRLDYGLYFELRKRFLDWLDQRDTDYRLWLQRQYSDLKAVNAKWQTKFETWEEIRYGGKQSQTFKQASQARREDMDRFAKILSEAGKPGIADIGEQEEIV